MSEPLRFKPVNPAHEMIYSTDGGWVSWEDYARLKAEVERLVDDRCLRGEAMKQSQTRIAFLTEEVSRLKAAPFFADKKLAVAYGSPEHLTAEIARLKAEVERLTKAGDAMVDEWWLQLSCPERMKKSWMQEQAIANWNAAKEGKGHA